MPVLPQTDEGITPQPIRPGIDLFVNGEPYRYTGDPDMPLLWYLRDLLRLTGCKYGCDDLTCGACSVLLDGKLARACELPIRELQGGRITTVEGLAGPAGKLHPLQQAWIEEDAILCGYCQPGMLIAAADLLARKADPSDGDIDGIRNVCRCGSHPRVRAAIRRAAAAIKGAGK